MSYSQSSSAVANPTLLTLLIDKLIDCRFQLSQPLICPPSLTPSVNPPSLFYGLTLTLQSSTTITTWSREGTLTPNFDTTHDTIERLSSSKKKNRLVMGLLQICDHLIHFHKQPYLTIYSKRVWPRADQLNPNSKYVYKLQPSKFGADPFPQQQTR